VHGITPKDGLLSSAEHSAVVLGLLVCMLISPIGFRRALAREDAIVLRYGLDPSADVTADGAIHGTKAKLDEPTAADAGVAVEADVELTDCHGRSTLEA